MFPFIIDPSHSAQLNSSSSDFQKFYRALHPLTDVEPGILILTRMDDTESSKLSLKLAKNGIPVHRIDCDGFLPEELYTISANGVLASRNAALNPRFVWLRHFQSCAVKNSDCSSTLSTKYVTKQLEAYAETLCELGEHTINHQCTAKSRFNQIRLAKNVGFNVPASTVEFAPSHTKEVIVKPVGSHWIEISPGNLIGCMPKALPSSQDLSSEPVPLLFQELIAFSYEVRVFFISETIISYSVQGCTTAKDLWVNQESVIIEHTSIPEYITNLIRDYRKMAQLDFGAIDLLVDEVGDYHFLECNVLFDWHYFESRCGDSRVTDALVEYFCKEFNDVSGI